MTAIQTLRLAEDDPWIYSDPRIKSGMEAYRAAARVTIALQSTPISAP